MSHHSLPLTKRVTGAVQQGLAHGATHGERRELQQIAHVPFDATKEFRRDAQPTHKAIERELRRRESQVGRKHSF